MILILHQYIVFYLTTETINRLIRLVWKLLEQVTTSHDIKDEFSSDLKGLTIFWLVKSRLDIYISREFR